MLLLSSKYINGLARLVNAGRGYEEALWTAFRYLISVGKMASLSSRLLASNARSGRLEDREGEKKRDAVEGAVLSEQCGIMILFPFRIVITAICCCGLGQMEDG